MSTVRLSIGNSSYSISSSNTTGGESYVSANGLFMDFTGTWVSESNTSVQIKVTDYYVENSTTKDYWFKVKNPSGTTSDLIRINKGNYRAFTPNWTLTWNKTHSAQTGVDKPWYIYWYTDSAGKNLDRTWTIHIYGDISAKPSYAVKYNANGGSPTPGAQTKWYGENLTLASAISKANTTVTYTVTLKGNGISDPAALKATKTTKYTFSGWNTNSGGTGTNYNAGATYSANAAVTLYAKFTSSSTTSSVTFPSPTRSGYTFGGWGTAANSTSATYNGGQTLSNLASNPTYYAIWKRTITYNGNVPSGVSVSNVPSPATSVASSNTTIASGSGNTPTRTGYLFKGWASSPSANTAEYQPGDNYAANKPSVTLYAIWQSTVTVGSLVSVRCNQSGTPDDEGTYALLTLPWSTDSAASNTPTASFSITDEDGNPITVSTLSLSGHSGTISKLVAGFNTEKQYDIAITVSETTKGGSATARDILSRAYFTMDVLGDAYYDYETHTGPRPGHGIAFGMPAKEEGMHVGYPITIGNGDNAETAIRYRGPLLTQDMIRFLPNNTDAYGNGIIIGGGGAVIIGSGESAYNLQGSSGLNIDAGTETTYVASDGNIEFYSGCNTIGNRKKMVFESDGDTVICSRLYRISTTMADSKATVSSSTAITGVYDQDGNGVQVGYSEIFRTSTPSVYRSFAVTNTKANVTTGVYLHAFDNGNRFISSNAQNRILWSGAWFMLGSHTASLSANVSDQLSGIVLCWSAYVDGSAKNYDWVYTFIPKHHTANHGSTGVGTVLATANFGAVGMKYVYVYNDHLVGHDKNDDTGSANGITYRNNYWVLRYVVGV